MVPLLSNYYTKHLHATTALTNRRKSFPGWLVGRVSKANYVRKPPAWWHADSRKIAEYSKFKRIHNSFQNTNSGDRNDHQDSEFVRKKEKPCIDVKRTND